MLKSAAFKVIGDPKLHCESCEQRVTRVLTTLQGVQRVSADAASQQIEVLFDPGELQSLLLSLTAELGYKTEPAEPTAAAVEQVVQGQRR